MLDEVGKKTLSSSHVMTSLELASYLKIVKKKCENVCFRFDAAGCHFVSRVLLFFLSCSEFMVLLIFDNMNWFLGWKWSKEIEDQSGINEQSPKCEIPLLYKPITPRLPLLPPVRIFHQFHKFRSFFFHPDDFCALRCFCVIRKRDPELQYILEMIHFVDYICQAFLNADTFFNQTQIKMLLLFRQLPRSILVVNGRYASSIRIPDHYSNERPEEWVNKASLTMWHAYLIPNSRRQLNCTRQGWCKTKFDGQHLPLRARVSKLLDCMAGAYADLERMIKFYSRDGIKNEIRDQCGTTFQINSSTLLQKWETIRALEMQTNKH